MWTVILTVFPPHGEPYRSNVLSLIFLRSSSSNLGISLLPITTFHSKHNQPRNLSGIPVQNIHNAIRSHPSVGVRVHNDHRASPHAPRQRTTSRENRLSSEIFPTSSLNAALKTVQYLADPFHVASRTHTHLDGVPALGHHGEKGIEGHHTVHRACGNLEAG